MSGLFMGRQRGRHGRVAMIEAKNGPVAKVPPDAVRVWRGFRLGSVAPQDFLAALGSVFIPVTAQLQSLHGLTAYLPTVMPLDKPSGVPDEVALVCYRTRKAFDDTELTVPGRACSSLHSTVFGVPPSEGSFPSALAESLKFDMPYYLFADQVDWMTGFTQVFAGSRPAKMTALDFASGLFNFAKDLQQDRPKGLEGAVLHVTEDWVLYWEHWTNQRASLRGRIAALPKLAAQILSQPHRAMTLSMKLTARHAGVAVKGGESFNIRFTRGGAKNAPAKRAGLRSSGAPTAARRRT
jgi:hypothetical protein